MGRGDNITRGAYVIFLIVVFGVVGLVLVSAGVFQDLGQSDFNGVYVNTSYNSSGFIQLNASIIGNVTSNTTNGSEMTGNENGLIGYWRFNESSWNGVSGEVKDVLGKYNGTGKNGANTSIGLLGNSGNFSGTTGTYVNEVQIKNSPELNPGTGSFTVTGWARSIARGGNGYQLYVAKRDNVAGGKNGYYLGLLEGSGIKFVVGDGTNRVDTSYLNINYTNWFHFAAVINRATNQTLLYINGSLGTSASITSVGNISNSWNLSIGNDEGQALLGLTYQYPVKGQIDEIAFWNKALNSSEILGLYNQGLQNITSVSTNGTNFTSGTYESVVKDTGSIVQWENISWNGLQIGDNVIGKANVFLTYFEGNANDENGINNGVLRDSPISVNGKHNLGYYFDGVDDYIEIADSDSLDLNSSFSIGAWINFSSLPGSGQWDGFIDKGLSGDNNGGDHNYYFAIDNGVWGSGYGISFGFENSIGNNNAARYQFTPVLGQWYHIVGVFNDSADSITIYVNGTQEVQTTGNTLTPFTQNQPVFIGRNQNGSSGVYYFNGVMDDVFISNKSLSLTQIQEIYNNNDYSSLGSSSVNGLRFQLRTSNDNVSWSSYTGSDGTFNSYYNNPGSLNLTNSRYLQYKSYFNDSDAKLYNISIGYDNLANLTVSLDSPADNYLTDEYNINITCSASSTTQLVNVTPYYSKFGWDASEPARIISGTTNTTTFTLNEITNTVLWNCYVCNVNGDCAFANSNKTIIGDILAPTINLVSPAEGYIENSSSSINFGFNATDNRASSLDCKLLIDNVEVASNSSVIPGIDTTLSSTFSNGNYTWKINCSDEINSAVSEERNLSVGIYAPYTPFWAKANTHTHTTNSDGDSSPAIVVGLYRNKGYNILAITDHGYVTNCTTLTNLSGNFICVSSEEWTSTKHVVRINVNSTYNNNIANIQNAVNAAYNSSGFAIVAHPNWTSTIWTLNDLTSLQNYTAMEIYNKVIERLSPDPYSVQKWDDVLKTGKKVFGVAADDMHQVNVDLGYGFTKVYMPEFTLQAYVNSMKSGYFYASQGPNMDSEPFSLVCDELNSYHMGESANCSTVRINATISATNSSFIMKNISFIKDGIEISFRNCSSQNCSFSYSENVSSSGYYRLQATDSNNRRIWSNPIWVTKIALPVIITVNSPENNSNTNDYTPLINISLNQQTSLWYNINNGYNVSLCNNCSGYAGYLTLEEGQNSLRFYANNSDNIIKEKIISINLDFNKSISENFSDNSSIHSISNAFWNNGKISFLAGSNSSYMFGDLVLAPILTTNNITSFYIEWLENNTENARGEGWYRPPITLKYQFGNSSWIETNSSGDYLVNGSSVSGLNSNNLSIMFYFEKNNNTPIDLLSFKLTWTEFTVPLITNVSVGSVSSSSAIVSWNTDLNSNSSVLYGVSSSLGSVSLLNDSVKSHSIILTGLNPSTGYFYKIMSCTDASCSYDPQAPYTPYSFTTQAVSNPPTDGGSSGGSGGGGGGGGGSGSSNKSLLAKLELSKIENIIAYFGDKKTLSLTAKNTGKIFLNNCKLVANGAISNWMYSKQSQGISPGENVNFIFDLNVPDDVTPGDYSLELGINCDELKQAQNLGITIPGGLQLIQIKEIKQNGNLLDVTYDFDGSSLNGKNVNIELWIVDEDNNEIKRVYDNFTAENGTVKRSVSIELPRGLTGIYSVYVASSSDLNNFVKQSIVLGKSSIAGFTIFDQPANKMIAYGVFLAIIAAGIFFIVWKGRKNNESDFKVVKRRKANYDKDEELAD